MFKTLLISVITFIFSQYCVSQKIQKGTWQAKLILNEHDVLPFKLTVEGSKKKPVFVIHNAEEKIQLTDFKTINDSFQVDFPNFHSYIRFVVHKKKQLFGKWTNLNKGNQYTIPFEANFGHLTRDNVLSEVDVTGRWKTTFSPTNQPDMAIGVFEKGSENAQFTGTFLTETGDYRFLDGYVTGKQLVLSCFDGSHAFLFQANFRNDSLFGTFNSGKHYKTEWIAEKNDAFSLRNPDSITYLVKKEAFTFKTQDLNGKEFSFPNPQFENKVVIIQIMGTWCPNCLDETRMLKDFYSKYKEKGLEIISIGYETPSNFEEQVQKINLLKQRLKIDYTLLVGGQANKSLASQQFSMLNEVISFPTAIVLNRKGEVVKIHTGFNGPGTGDVYTNFVSEMDNLLKTLLF